ncbi:MAG: hypothetical protein BWK73_53800, partial [Thiothrix lacustris]
PGLKSKLPDLIIRAYNHAVKGAVRETGLAPEVFPPNCPWTFEQFMDEAFWPESSTTP